jgi:hypothetical protein
MKIYNCKDCIQDRHKWKKIVEKAKTFNTWIIGPEEEEEEDFFQQLWHLWDNTQKCGGDGEVTDDDIVWCMCLHAGLVRLHVCVCAPACAHTHTHTLILSTHVCAHIQKYIILVALPLQQWFGEHVSVLQYMYVASLVYYYLFTVAYFHTYAFSILWCLIIISYDGSVMCVRVMWFQVVVKLVLAKWKLMPVVLLVDMSLSTMEWKINGCEMGAIGWVAYNLPAVAP